MVIIILFNQILGLSYGAYSVIQLHVHSSFCQIVYLGGSTRPFFEGNSILGFTAGAGCSHHLLAISHSL